MSGETTQETEAIVVPAPVTTFTQQEPGLLVAGELEKALEGCKERVERIAKECRAKNRRFRDVEFDLENDQYKCLHGLNYPVVYSPSDIQRVTQIFEKPQFFINEADSNDIVQGKLEDCWFLSALATVSAAKGLVEKLCVARDEDVGVYGFVFFRDNSWVNVIVDDMLYTSVPKYEELSYAEKELYHEDKAQFNKSARKGGKALYFAKSGIAGETWVPLIEKAYAKLHGDYVSLSGGRACEAVEDLTGGVSTIIRNKDILDVDRFWNEELSKANKDRLFGCSFESLDTARSGVNNVKVDGLMGGHAYSVLQAVELKGKRFVVLRNPWGRSGWTGKWSDGSKEWSAEWLGILPVLKNGFADDGQFIMEYDDFLQTWDEIHRTMLFDSTWMMSSKWLQIPTRPLPSAWSFGDVCFTFKLDKPTFAIIVLSQLDGRYFKEISGASAWNLDFVLTKRGEKEPLGEAASPALYSRSINLEMHLAAGEYVVYVRIDRVVLRDPDYFKKGVDGGWDHRKLARVLTERTKSRSVASNFKLGIQEKYLITELTALIDKDMARFEEETKAEALKREREQSGTTTVTVTTVTTTTTKKTETVVKKQGSEKSSLKVVANLAPGDSPETPEPGKLSTNLLGPGHAGYSPTQGPLLLVSPPQSPDQPSRKIEICEDEDSIFLGLRVYTDKEAPAVIAGRLRADMLPSDRAFTSDLRRRDVMEGATSDFAR